MNFDDFDNDDELSFLMEQEQQEQGDNISTPTQAGRTHPLPHDPDKHFAWGIYKSKKNKGRRPTCRTESCYNKQFNHFRPPPPPPPPPATMAYGGGNRKKRNIKKRTRKNKYSSKSSKKSQPNRIQKKTRKYK